uniref:Uncharacterized protein n=1 Tax=Opuntia streptacantha TaxID=393608 RepID=A0A7C9AYK1_OPUST
MNIALGTSSCNRLHYSCLTTQPDQALSHSLVSKTHPRHTAGAFSESTRWSSFLCSIVHNWLAQSPPSIYTSVVPSGYISQMARIYHRHHSQSQWISRVCPSCD